MRLATFLFVFKDHILLITAACLFADLHSEIRMQERVFMGIGHKPFMDIQPSEMAINDRAINCSPTWTRWSTCHGETLGSLRDRSYLTLYEIIGGISVLRLNSVGSASYTSSSSSGWGSTSPVGHLIGPSGGDVVRYVHGTSGILEEDDLDQESGNQSTLGMSSSQCCLHKITHAMPDLTFVINRSEI